MPRYVILRHEPVPASERPLHWDLMLESSDGLLTWALETEPCYNVAISATQLPDHRLEYLDYEGPVSGNRGHVRRTASGSYRWIEQDERKIVVEILGESLQGRLQLERDESSSQRWVVVFSESEFSTRR